MKTVKTIKNSIGTFKLDKSNSGKSTVVTHIYRGKECGQKIYWHGERINFSEVRRITLAKKVAKKGWGEICEKATFHHSAKAKGYATKDMVGKKTPYAGKFGKGYILIAGKHPHSNGYHTIEYWIV